MYSILLRVVGVAYDGKAHLSLGLSMALEAGVAVTVGGGPAGGHWFERPA